MSLKLNPNYSYEYNKILNPKLNEDEQIKNFASLLSDKERFLDPLIELEKNLKTIFEEFGFPLVNKEFYIVRAELFKSFSLPITVEYSLIPEEMHLFLLKELLKSNLTQRFPDDLTQEQYLNAFVKHIVESYDFGSLNLKKVYLNIEAQAQEKFENYSPLSLDFKEKSFNDYLEELYVKMFS